MADTNIELNKKLLNALYTEELDFEYVEKLLEEGANPLDAYNEFGSTILEDMFCNCCNEDDNGRIRSNINRVVQLFIKYGMQPEEFKEELENEDGPIEMWCLAFSCCKETFEVLKLLLDNGLSINSLESFIRHFIEDADYVGGTEINGHYKEYLINGIKMIMLSASYERVLNNSDFLKECISFKLNEANKDILYKFTDFDRFEYEFDKSTCDYKPFGLKNMTVYILEKETNDIVWKFFL